MKQYVITQEEFETIQHFTRMFEMNAETVQNLCKCERDDIVYGYELGQMYTHLRSCFADMLELESLIRNRPTEDVIGEKVLTVGGDRKITVDIKLKVGDEEYTNTVYSYGGDGSEDIFEAITTASRDCKSHYLKNIQVQTP